MNHVRLLIPENATPAMEAAAERYWNARRFAWFSDDPRTWNGVYRAMTGQALLDDTAIVLFGKKPTMVSQDKYDATVHTLSKNIADLRSAMAEVVGCFEAAEAEGMSNAIQEDATDRLQDLWERRILHALYAAQEALEPNQSVLPSACDGKEQNAFEARATTEGMAVDDVPATYALEDVKDAYAAGYYEGAGDDAWYSNHNDEGDLAVDATVLRPMHEYITGLLNPQVSK